MQELNIKLSDAAITYIKNKIQTEQGLGMRLTIQKTGCSGFAYAPSIIQALDPEEIAYPIDNHFTLYIDKKWLHILQDIEIDYIEDNKVGLKQKRLEFKNAKEGNRCGCGESFQLK
jgi:iron-sulfur cluster assembly protein